MHPASFGKRRTVLVTAAQKVKCNAEFHLRGRPQGGYASAFHPSKGACWGPGFHSANFAGDPGFARADSRVFLLTREAAGLPAGTRQESAGPGHRLVGGKKEARREGLIGEKRKRSQRQQVPRAPQPNCALYSDRMSDSRRFETYARAA
jgi:hypothetical protein